MIQLHQPPPVWGLPNMSPFCVKLETYLRMAKIEYKPKRPNFKEMPKGRIPYVKIDGKVMGDSGLIMDALKKKFGDSLDAHLTKEQRAQALALRRMTEEHLYFGMAWLRWNDEASYGHVKTAFLKYLPPVIGGFILKRIRKGFLQMIVDAGIGAHSRNEIIALCKEDVDAISVLLGDQDYFFGKEPSSIDATMYGFLIHGLWVPWMSEMTEYIKGHKNLEAYCQRMKARYWA